MSDTTVPPARFARTRPVIAAGGLDALAVRLVQRGFLQGDAAGAPFLVQPSDILVLDLAQPSNFASAPSTETQEVTLWLPRDSMSVHGTDEDTLHGVVLHGSSPGGAVVGAALAALAQHAGGMNVREMDALAGGTIGLIASALGPELHKRRPSIGPTAATLARIRRFIEAHLASPVLAGEFGLSRSALYRLFEPVGGVAGYIRRERLRRVFRDITSPEFANLRLSQLASRWGLRDQTTFSRAYRQVFGMTPREARAAALAHRAPVKLSTDGPGILATWIAQICVAARPG